MVPDFRTAGDVLRQAPAAMRMKVGALEKGTAGDVRRRARIARFRLLVWSYCKKNGRHDLLWRKTRDPYRILVSEVMLQQTQVPRVKEKYKEFLGSFPTVRVLAKASLGDVLRVWSGLGYNRRGKYLHDAAKAIVRDHEGKVPNDFAALRKLPGVGPYTASAIRVFAFNEPDVLIETNIRSAYIHHFSKIWTFNVHISDEEIRSVAQKAARGQDPREWHSALMDYGVHIKKLHKNPSRKSATYIRQSKFEGSLRQVRGAILRALQARPQSEVRLRKSLLNDGFRKPIIGFKKGLAGLARDGLILEQKGKWRIA